MAAELVQQQSMRQEQTMTHHQIQALEMLFTPALELNTIINNELEKNPVLEKESDKYEPLEVEGNNNVDDAKSGESDEWIEKLLQLNDKSSYKTSFFGNSSENNEERQHFFNSLVEEKTLQESLLDQLNFLNLEEELLKSCEAVVSSLNDKGYLKAHPADLAMALRQSVENIEKSVKIIQNLEPAGVAAIDLKERLLLQLERNGMEGTTIYEVVQNHIEDIGTNHLPKIAKEMNITMEELKDILEEIHKLNPHLADTTKVKEHNYIQEEVLIMEEKGKLKVKILNEHLPVLKISSYYQELMKQANTDPEVKEYIKSKINGGLFLINSLTQRQSTIRNISEAILKNQDEFFRKGMDHLKPLTMSQVAEAAGVHETTVSRAVSGKYLRCKYGLLALRFFFSPGYKSENGKIISNIAVKKIIKEKIQKENTKKPLSDSNLAEILKEHGLNIARRTVAKYREHMGILSSNLRKEY